MYDLLFFPFSPLDFFYTAFPLFPFSFCISPSVFNIMFADKGSNSVGQHAWGHFSGWWSVKSAMVKVMRCVLQYSISFWLLCFFFLSSFLFHFHSLFYFLISSDNICSLARSLNISHTTTVVASTSSNKQVVPDPLSRVRQCKSHAREEHHFFLNYQVWSEGSKHPDSSVCHHPVPPLWDPSRVPFLFSVLLASSPYLSWQERSMGLVEVIYETLAPSKLNGEDIFIFWDKKCLNDGQDWEEGFMHGITHSTAIILIINEKVCSQTRRCR